MKKNKKRKRRGCITGLLVAVIFALGVIVGLKCSVKFPDGGLADLLFEYADRAVDVAMKKANEILPAIPYDKNGERAGSDIFEESDCVDHTVNRLLYEQLTENGKYIYRAMYGATVGHKTTVLIPTVSEDEMRAVHFALRYDNPQLLCIGDEFFCVNLGKVSYIKMSYVYSEEVCKKMTDEMMRNAKKLCAECSGLDEFERELYIHDVLSDGAQYSDKGDFAHCAAGVINDGKGVCSSYALAMKLLLDISGIKSFAVQCDMESNGKEISHVWLVVNIDGKWYHTDPTWDDPVVTNGKDRTVHAYFNIPTKLIENDHKNFVLPEEVVCDSFDANYYMRKGLYCRSDDWKSVIKSKLTEATDESGAEIEFMFESKELYEEADDRLHAGELNDMLQEIVTYKKLNIESRKVATLVFENTNSLHYTITFE